MNYIRFSYHISSAKKKNTKYVSVTIYHQRKKIILIQLNNNISMNLLRMPDLQSSEPWFESPFATSKIGHYPLTPLLTQLY